jgi:hypothetical protein
VNYFEYNENKLCRKLTECSKAQLDVIEPPDYWVSESAKIPPDVYARFAAAAFVPYYPAEAELLGNRTVGFMPEIVADYGAE